MKPILLMLLASVASAQIRQDARALLTKVVDNLRPARSWRVEFSFAGESRSGNELSFVQATARETVQGGRRARIEGLNGVVLTCDGVTAWRYHPSLNSYAAIPVARYQSCRGFFPEWSELLIGIKSAAIVGRESIPFEGVATQCEVVRAEYALPLNSGAEVAIVRLLWIEPRRGFVLREVEERTTPANDPARSTSTVLTTTTYNRIEKNPVLPEIWFRFDPPPNSMFFSEYPLPEYYLKGQPPAESGLDTLPAWVLRVGNGVLAPVAVSKVAPEYTEGARQARIQGKVTMLVWVSSEGIPELMRITHSLDPDLDWKAIEAVRSWRFTPGQKDGKPVYTAISMDVDFRLP